jgi:hypothetical protein
MNGAMTQKKINIWIFCNQIIKHSSKLILMDGDISQRSLRLASLLGYMNYVKNNNDEANTEIKLVCDHAYWAALWYRDIANFKE